MMETLGLFDFITSSLAFFFKTNNKTTPSTVIIIIIIITDHTMFDIVKSGRVSDGNGSFGNLKELLPGTLS